jgi:heat shock protein 90kDa beta
VLFDRYLANETKASTDAEKKTDDDAAVEDDKDDESKKKKAKTVDKTVWDWELMNESKPIWQRK